MNRQLEKINECNPEKHNLVGERALIKIETIATESEGGIVFGDSKTLLKRQPWP